MISGVLKYIEENDLESCKVMQRSKGFWQKGSQKVEQLSDMILKHIKNRSWKEWTNHIIFKSDVQRVLYPQTFFPYEYLQGDPKIQ